MATAYFMHVFPYFEIYITYYSLLTLSCTRLKNKGELVNKGFLKRVISAVKMLSSCFVSSGF